ncbi:hypothetical protein F5B17DRAFT_391082 [Nemania serpens]|nr:hypothetical protein F5B17DRAFT_391082 [Nemania serpens]
MLLTSTNRDLPSLTIPLLTSLPPLLVASFFQLLTKPTLPISTYLASRIFSWTGPGRGHHMFSPHRSIPCGR